MSGSVGIEKRLAMVLLREMVIMEGNVSFFRLRGTASSRPWTSSNPVSNQIHFPIPKSQIPFISPSLPRRYGVIILLFFPSISSFQISHPSHSISFRSLSGRLPVSSAAVTFRSLSLSAQNKAVTPDRTAISALDRAAGAAPDRTAVSALDRATGAALDRAAFPALDRAAVAALDRAAGAALDRAAGAALDRAAGAALVRAAGTALDRAAGTALDRAGKIGMVFWIGARGSAERPCRQLCL